MKMSAEGYFKRYGCIYGISYKYAFGERSGYAKKFTDLSKAYKWLHTEEYDFRTRELVSKAEAQTYM